MLITGQYDEECAEVETYRQKQVLNTSLPPFGRHSRFYSRNVPRTTSIPVERRDNISNRSWTCTTRRSESTLHLCNARAGTNFTGQAHISSPPPLPIT